MKTRGMGVVVVVLLVTMGLAAWSGGPVQAAEDWSTGAADLEGIEQTMKGGAAELDLESTSQPGVIAVSGEAEVRVVPDEVILTLGVETWDESLEVAKRQNDERVKQVLTLAQKYQIPPQYVQTDFISVEPRYEDDYEKREFVGFFVRKTIVVTMREISRFEEFLTSVLQNGVNYVHGIEFRTTELRRYRDQARALAIRAAREKANALAQELGQKVGKPKSIQEEPGGWWSWYNSWWGSRWGGGMTQNVVQNVEGAAWQSEGSIALGQITVHARVSVTFELQ